jgi:hypothetical protein
VCTAAAVGDDNDWCGMRVHACCSDAGLSMLVSSGSDFLRLRGLPFSATPQDICDFFADARLQSPPIVRGRLC